MENKIIESKQKSLALKRAQEEIKEKVKEFGLHRARYKENINNKYELKNMITMYVNKNKLSSPLLKRYSFQNENEILKNKKNENDSNIENISIMAQNNLNKGINKNDSIRTIREKQNTMKKIGFSYSQKIKLFDFKDIKEINDNNNRQYYKYTPKRTFSKRRTKFVKKRSNSQTAITTSIRIISDSNKIKTDNIQNIDIKTNNIFDKNNIKIDDYKMSLPKEQISSLIINKNKNNISKATDSFTTITSHLPLIKEKLVFENICNIKSRNNDNKNIKSKNEQDSNDSKDNYHFSSFNKYNILKINNLGKRISDKKNLFNNLNNRYNLYKDNYLKMRKTISKDKKKEYESLLGKLREKSFNDYYNEDYEDEFIEPENAGNNNSIFINNINGKTHKMNKNNSLMQAIVNPNDNPSYSRYYLPRSGSMLLSRDELSKKFLK